MSKENKAAKNMYKREELISLYLALASLKNVGIEKADFIKLILLRVKLKDVHDQYESTKNELTEQTKPKGWKEGDSQEEWNKLYVEVLTKYLVEEIPFEHNIQIFSIETIADLLMGNIELKSADGDIITKYLLKD